jgi:hypothetical protein
MPDPEFQVTGVETDAQGMVPLMRFRLRITNALPSAAIHSILLHTQIQIEPAQRTYNQAEQEKLIELFGTPDRWGQTLRNRLWAHADTTIGAFTTEIEAALTVPCTYDLNIASAKYFHALDNGEVSLLFLFSGSIFYAGKEGRLQVERISWNKECRYRIPVLAWQQIMTQHYPNSAWLYLRRDIFDQLYDYKLSHGLATWEQVVEQLLSQQVADVAPA